MGSDGGNYTQDAIVELVRRHVAGTEAKDRLCSEMDFTVNRRAEIEITQRAAKLNRVEDRLHDIHHELSRAGR